jgi:hypothetical protein
MGSLVFSFPLQKGTLVAKKFCFVLSPIGEYDSLERRRADGILDEVIRSAFEPLGYRVERADHDVSPGRVTETIISKIIDADLVVADLTGFNPNVMYELALRHATGKPFIQLLERGGKLPFDVQDINTIFFTSDLAGRGEAIKKLTEAESKVAASLETGNPIRRTVDFKGLKSSGTDADRVILDALSDLARAVSQLRSDQGQRAAPEEVVLRTNALSAIQTIMTHHELDAFDIRVVAVDHDSRGIHATATSRFGELSYSALGDPIWQRSHKQAIAMAMAVVRGLVGEYMKKMPDGGSADTADE